MPPPLSVHQITRVVSDGTGWTQEEVWLRVLLASAVAVVATVLHAVDAVLRLLYELGDR
jgi:hypothetical protein